nr:MAG TPA: hypothetical protein [Caudoviricetes sp.]DAY26591.1 MAG TPA: hypothetical protein [Caudoviricetes sp.]
MRKFKNLKTNCIEMVTNQKLFEQYEKYSDVYEEIFDKKDESNKEEKSNKKDESNKEK